MTNDIVGGLFGVSPVDVSNQYVTQDSGQAMQFAQLNPQQQGQYGMFMAGSGLGRLAGNVIGGGDPAMQRAQQMQQVKQWITQSGVDINTPEGLLEAARYANSIGATEGAMFLGQQAIAKRKSMAEVGTAEENLQRGQQYRAAVAELQKNPNATEQDYINLARQFSGPEAGMTAAINAQSRADIAQQKQAIKDEQTQLKQQEASKLAFERASNIVDATSEAINLVHGRSAGPLGQQLMAIGGTDAANLESKLKTVKSLLAVTELQKIREASKTGGALGNVSNKDIDLLESTVTNLNQKQSPDELRKGLEKVKQLYSKILEDAGIKAQQPAGQQPAQQPAATNVRRWNPKTGEIE